METYTIIIKGVLETGAIFFAFMSLFSAILLFDYDNYSKNLDRCIYCAFILCSLLCTYFLI